jgi:SSS family solute:Na+ symporter
VTSAAVTIALVLLTLLAARVVHLYYHEVVQVVLLVLLVAPLAFMGLRATGGWIRLRPVRLVQAAVNSQLPQTFYTHMWKGMGDVRTNALGVEWVGLLLGVGFVLSFGYWCTDHLVTQRALAADGGRTPRWAPLIAALPKLALPMLLVLPGLTALILGGGEGGAPYGGMGQGVLIAKRDAGGTPLIDTMGRTVLDFDSATPLLLTTLAPPGMLGLGLVALLAAALAGIVGNLFAFRGLWRHELAPGGGADGDGGGAIGATLGALALAVVAAWGAQSFNNVMELLQLVVALVHAPLLAIVGLGMLWQRATARGALAGLGAGVVAALAHHALAIAHAARPGIAGGYLAPLLVYRSELALAAWTAIVAFTTALVVGGAVSLLTPPRPADELYGLVRSLLPPPAPGSSPRVRGATAFAVLLVGGAIALNLGLAR